MEQNNETIKQAKEELEAVCRKHQVNLVPVIVHQGDRTFSSIEIVPLQRSEEAPKAE